jgi:hypothetical protein
MLREYFSFSLKTEAIYLSETGVLTYCTTQRRNQEDRCMSLYSPSSHFTSRQSEISFHVFYAYFPYFEKNKVGLWNHLPGCV